MRKLFVLAMALLLVVSGTPPLAHPTSAHATSAHAPSAPDTQTVSASEGPFRTHVSLHNPQDLQRVRDLGATVLQAGDAEAVVLVTADQLADLARLGFRPSQTDSLDSLVSNRPNLSLTAVRLTVHSAPELILAPASTDSDGDGLTDTEEAWWCTDPHSQDSDSDLVKDGDEVTALVNWMHDPRAGRPSSGKPFIGWPPSHTGCYDDDYDSVPDLAETNMLGLNINLESTDRDKFDDGHELFGNTYCPGGAGACSYGYLPRDVDGGIIPPQMPTWVEAPGNHPMVAASPDPVIEVVEDSLRVDRVAIITTEEGGMTQETHTYESSVMRGTSTAVMNMQTWNRWQEVAASEPAGLTTTTLEPLFLDSNGQVVLGLPKWLKVTGGVLGVASAVGTIACVAMTLGVGTPACIALGVAGIAASGIGLADAIWDDPDAAQRNMNTYPSSYITDFEIGNPQLVADNQRSTSETQDVSAGGSGDRYSVNSSSQVNVETIVQVSAPTRPPVPSMTYHHGAAHGGAHAVTTTEYEEHTITDGYAFTSGANWSTAWTTDTVHAADLRFSYRVCNEGTDYAREVTGLIFNVYLRGDPNPIHTYNASAQIGTLNNVMPDECHTYTSDPIALTLDEMRAVDTGTNLYVVVEDYAFGNDELFYQDAVNGGVTVGIEDGFDDGDELIDYYVLPTWGTEPLQTVIQRYFPTIEDEGGNLVTIYTPEFTTPPTFNERALINNNWWNVYFSDGLDYTNGLSQTMSAPGTAVLFRLGSDRDYDGYNDRTETQLGTDPDSTASYPHPELVAGYTVTRTGNTATVLMSFLNKGNYDAYGVEAVMFAPDDTVTVGNNTIGGGGRVSSGQQVVLGPRVMDPGLGNWTGTAEPYATGHYIGTRDKVYTFVAGTSGTIGSGTLNCTWNDGAGNNGTLNFGNVYHPPLALDVAEGLEVGFDTGTVMAGDFFTVEVRLPRDTMTYTVNSEPYAPPMIVVSYNDPQGNHRFITPVEMGSIYDDLSEHAGEMLHDVGVDITTLEPVDPAGPNTTYFVVNNPYMVTLEDAHVHVNVANITGTVVARWTLTQTLSPGPTVLSDVWETTVFTQPYQADEDYLMLAFWTDYQGNIIDTIGRLFSSFGPDPMGRVATTDLHWDFGTVARGTVVDHELTIANEGRNDLFVWMDQGTPTQMRLNAQLDKVYPSDLLAYSLRINTSDVPTGPFSQTIPIRTSDLHNPTLGLLVNGEILTPASNIAVYDVPWQPWSQRIYAEGPRSQDESIEFTHSLHSAPDRFQPVEVLDFPHLASLGDGDTFSDLGDFQIARLFTATNAIRLYSPYSFTVGHSFVVPYAFESDLLTGGDETLSVTIPYAEYEKVTLVAQSPAIGIYDDFESPKWIPDTGSTARAQSETKVTSDQPDNYLRVYAQGQSDFFTSAGASATTAADFKGTPITVFEFRENIESYSYCYGNSAAYVTIAGNSASVTVYSISTSADDWHDVFSESEEYTGTIVFHHDTQTADFYKNGELVTAGINLSGLDAYRVQFTSGAGTSSSGCDSLTHATHQVYWTTINNGVAYDDFESPKWIPDTGSTARAQSETKVTSDQPDNYLRVYAQGQSDFFTSAGASATTAADFKGTPITVFEFREDIESYSYCYGSSAAYVTIAGDSASVTIYSISTSADAWDDVFSESEEYTGTIVFHHDTQTADFYKNGELVTAGINLSGLDAYRVQFTSGAGTSSSGCDSLTHATHQVYWTRAYGSEPLLALTIGNTAPWEPAVPQFEPLSVRSPDLAPRLNDFLASTYPDMAGFVTVPITISRRGSGLLYLSELVLTPTIPISSDVGLDAGDLKVFPLNPTEGETVVISATLRNDGSQAVNPFVVAFIHGDPVSGTLLGGMLVETIEAKEVVTVSMPWDTSSHTGTQTITVVADPTNRLSEVNEDNNEATTNLTVLTKPDLQIISLVTDKAEIARGQAVTLTAVVSNSGQTDAPASTLAFYEGTPISGTLVHSTTIAVSAGDTVTVGLPWTATALGAQVLAARADLDDAVTESREDNNVAQVSLYIGWGVPVYVDAGGNSDPVYSPTLGYGLVSTTTTVITSCGSAPYQTYRQGIYGRPLEYRFDYLLSSHYYHLDTTLSVCSGQRIEYLWVDGVQLAGPLTVTATSPVCRSSLVNAATYVDHSIVAGVTSTGLAAPVVAEVRLSDVYYCYRDSGSGENDPPYSPDIHCGYYDPLSQGADMWGNTPTLTVRFDLNDSDVVYRFSGLEPGKRYAAHLTLYEGDGAERQETVRMDGITVGPTVTLSSQPQYLSVDLPPEAYASDGVVDVAVVETTGWNAPVVSEIAVEEMTLSTPISPPLSVPSNGSTISDTTPTFGWESVSGASIYRIQVDDDAGFGSPEIDQTTANLSYTPSGALPYGTYQWRVRASNGCSNGSWSLAWTVTITLANTPPTLSGMPDQLFDHSTRPPGTFDLWAYGWDAQTPSDVLTYTIVGTPPAGAGVTLTGNRTVTVNPSPNWCGGTNVTIRATDPGGLWDSDTFRVAVSWSCPGPVAMPGAPVLVAPVDGSNAASSTPAFAWRPVIGANTYQMQLDDDADFASPERDETTSSTDYVPASGLSGGVYHWRVRAVSGSEVGDWSAGWTFTAPGLSPPGFKVYLPVAARGYP